MDDVRLVKLPEEGLLRVIEIDGCHWHEFDLAKVLVVVIQDHPIGIETMSAQIRQPECQ